MNKKRTTYSAVIALAVLLANALTVLAYPADPPDVPPAPAVASTCVHASQASVDIPATQVEYMLLDGARLCPVVASTSVQLIPNTGSQKTGYNDPNFLAFKERQIQSMMQ